MKKLFAIFCAVCLMPSFSAQAWIGGPFSNSSYFGTSGVDGVYEAVATGPNTIGFVRIVIGNNFAGLQPATPATTTGQPIATDPSINGSSFSGNVIVGAIGSQANTFWFSQGISYAGRAFGSVQENNAIFGIATANGVSPAPGYTVGDVLNATFTAGFQNTGGGIVARRFFGAGRFDVLGTNAIANQPLIVTGSKVSHQILFGT